MAATIMTHLMEANTAADFAVASALALGGMVAARVATKVYEGRVKARLTESGSKAVEILPHLIGGAIIPFLYLIAVYAGLRVLDLPAKADKVINSVGIAALAFFAAKFAIQLSIHALENYRAPGEVGPSPAFKSVAPLLKTLIWGICAIFVLDNIGFNVSAVVAGLGIGGVALALASQAVLGDLFSYFVILFDRPFEVGDSIMIDDLGGVVESVGIKTTRIRNQRGEEVVVSNTALTSARLHNFKKMSRRRVFARLGVVYETPTSTLKEIPSILEEIVKSLPGLTLERAHFASFGDFALVFELAYYVESADYIVYMDRQQEVNFRLAEEFGRRGIVFAHTTPTATAPAAQSQPS
jgi:small-conductance mechanosensitive channel